MHALPIYLQLGNSPFQFGIDYRNKSNNTTPKQESPRVFNKYTPGIATVKTAFTPSTNANSPTGPMPSYGNVNGGLETRRQSYNKYTTPAQNHKNPSQQKNELNDEKKTSSTETNKAPEFGITYSPKKFTPSKDILNQLQSSSPKTSQQTSPSHNKYTPMLKKEGNTDSGLNKINRSTSMSAYERNLKKSSVPEPSTSYNRLNRTFSESSGLTGLNRVGGSNNVTGLNRVSTGTNSLTGLNKTGPNLTSLKSVNEEVSRNNEFLIFYRNSTKTRKVRKTIFLSKIKNIENIV